MAALADVRPMVPTELVQQILLATWRDTSVFAPSERWKLVKVWWSVSTQFQASAFWVVTHHVKILGGSSTDLDAYAWIGRQLFELSRAQRTPEAYNGFLEDLYGRSTVELDITYACCWVRQKRRGKWLEDSIFPHRPDNPFALLKTRFFLPRAYKMREQEYQEWFSLRQRDRLSGWFANLLEVIPDCTACIISADHVVEPFTVSGYVAVLESICWWKSLKRVHFCDLPGLGKPDWTVDVVGEMHGEMPCLPPLPSVTSVSMAYYPFCDCEKREGWDTHGPTCITQRMLLPFVNLEHLRIDTSSLDDVDLPAGVHVALEVLPNPTPKAPTTEEGAWYEDAHWWMVGHDNQYFAFDDTTNPPRTSAMLNIPANDALWATIAPQTEDDGRPRPPEEDDRPHSWTGIASCLTEGFPTLDNELIDLL
ncbi:hypothetical protein C8Q74DRAFT_1365581 [Fomes fomentarius]|nr:hypothetical protein C8Q74DRAFT_1365581 [Fomes fomentarius]